MSRKELEALGACPLFGSFDPSRVEEFASTCRAERLGEGGRIFAPHDEADRFFLVLAGQVKVYKLSTQGKEQILHYYGPGKTFGEAAMWLGGTYPAFAEAVADTRLLVVTRKRIVEAIRRDPELAVGMIAGLSAKLHEFERLIAELSLKDVLGRLAGALLKEAQKAGSPTFRLPQSKRQLASQLGTVAETLSRALKKLEDAGWISVRGSELTIRNRRRLAESAEVGIEGTS